MERLQQIEQFGNLRKDASKVIEGSQKIKAGKKPKTGGDAEPPSGQGLDDDDTAASVPAPVPTRRVILGP